MHNYVIGVLGGIGSGKSTVVDILKEFGCCAIHADPIVHEVLALPEIIEQIRAYWRVNDVGTVTRADLPAIQVLDEGHPFRPGIAKLVFQFKEERKFLENITFPFVDKRIRELLDIYSNGWHPAIILDVPLLIEMQYWRECIQVLFVDCPPYQRVNRYAIRTQKLLGDAKDDLEARESVQMSLERKKSYAHVVLDNSGVKEQLQEQVRAWWDKLAACDYIRGPMKSETE